MEGSGAAKHPKWRFLAGGWGEHIVACADGVALTTVLLGADTEITWAPLPVAQALALLGGLWDAYKAAWAAPAPVACETACAWLRVARNDPAAAALAMAAARTVFDGGERTRSSYLAAAFDDFEAIEAALPAWAPLLYGAMLDHTLIGHAPDNSLEAA
jgi:exodeoxyribonuclease V gamma subunit